MNVGFVGLGAMGLPMAERVIKAGFKTYTTFHRHREPAEALAALGATVLATPAHVAQAADVIITIVPADRELEETVLGPSGLLKSFAAGKVLIEMTSAMARTMLEVDQAIRAAGGRVLDAPVSGGVSGAAGGTLTIMVGGDAALLNECRPLLEAMGNRIVHVGAVGQGKVVKMINQMMAAVHLVTIGEAFALGVRCGASPAILYEVIKESSGYSKMLDLRLPNFLLAGTFQPGFKLDLMKKDVNIALDSARAEGVPMLLASTVAQIFSAASASGKGSADYSYAAQFVADMAQVKLNQAQGGSRHTES